MTPQSEKRLNINPWGIFLTEGTPKGVLFLAAVKEPHPLAKSKILNVCPRTLAFARLCLARLKDSILFKVRILLAILLKENRNTF